MSPPDAPAGLLTPETLDHVRFDDRGLVPVVAQDRTTGNVLMVAWANREAVARTLETGVGHFWSRSRHSLWRKGETSGNELSEARLYLDCDGDTLLMLADPAGPACHTGEATCFRQPPPGPGTEVRRLWETLRTRSEERPEGSYTVKLLDDPNLRLKKLGEETTELVVALSTGDSEGAAEEAADLVYHLMAALIGSGVQWSDVEAVLAGRRG